MSFAAYKDYASNRKQPKSKTRKCARCGEEFRPLSHNRGGGSSRKYCYNPDCEEAREREKREKYRKKKEGLA